MIFQKALSLALATAMVAGGASLAVSAQEFKMPDLVIDSGSEVGTIGQAYVVDGVIIGDTIVSDNTIYVFAGTRGSIFVDTDFFKFSSKKGDNSKLIKKISLVEKDLAAAPGREWWVKIEINEDMTDTEYHMNPSFSFTAKKDTPLKVGGNVPVLSGDKVTFTVKFWVKNQEIGGTDQTYEAGQKSQYAKPVKNDKNEIVWAGINRDFAKLSFIGDSDTKTYYPKLSTKWDNDMYAANFVNGEAFKFEFVTGPTISATARPTLTIYNPFINDDENYTVDVADLTVYQLIDGEFVNVTDKFTAGTDDDGNQVLTTKTRTLGYYVICDKTAVAAAAASDSGEITTDAPVKDVPDTGR